MNSTAPDWPLHLGCPVWACGEWAGQVYPPRTPRRKWLEWYSRTFNAVEGNSTFYAIPKTTTTRRWARQSAAGFRFCFKFPAQISHELQLVGADDATNRFLKALEPLAEADRLGPTLLQLGASFGPDQLRVLTRFLHTLPRDFSWAVELRHHSWFDSGDNEHRVNELFSRHRVDKVLFDSRPLFQSPPDDDVEAESQQTKPQTPVRQTVTGKHPLLRLVGRNRVELADRFLDQWAGIVAGWVNDGLQPYVFAHAPRDTFAPAFARRLAQRLQREMPERNLTVPLPPKPASQLSLLD